MNFTEYFIRHKVIAIIINVMILIVGALSFKNIPLSEYPDIQLPLVRVVIAYPNADAELVESEVTNVVEDKISGIRGIKNITSESSFSSSSILVNFDEGTNLDQALIDLRDSLAQAKSRMPKDVKEPEIFKGGQQGGVPFFAISITSKEMDFGELTHYANHFLKNNFRSIKGVSDVEIWGRPYTMQVTIDQKKIYNYGLNVSEISAAIKRNNISLPAGNFRDKIPASIDLRLSSENDFRETYIATKNNKEIYLKDIANVKLISDPKGNRIKVNGNTAVIILVQKATDANPLEVTNLLRAKAEEVKKILPDHMDLSIDIDQSIFINSSIKNIYYSIFEAIILVLIIVYLFLGNFRSTMVPLVTIPISLIGSAAVILSFGMSLNVFSLLAMVLAIGLVVDDAIIVLENITRHIENGMKPLQASIKGSKEIGFAIIAMTCTLASVYAPIAFAKGIAGQLFIEFAITLAGSVIISGIVALTLSPMMCSVVMNNTRHNNESFMSKILTKLEIQYSKLLKIALTKPLITIIIILSSLSMIYLVNKFTPHELVPKEDRSLLGIFIPPQPGKNLDDMEFYTDKLDKILDAIPEKKNYLTFMGNWGAQSCLLLKNHEDRKRSQQEIVSFIEPLAKEVPNLDAYPWGWDTGLPGIGDTQASSFLTFAISTTGNYKELAEAANKMLKKLNETGKFIFIKHDTKFDTKKYNIIIDNNRMYKLQIEPSLVSETTSTFFSGNRLLEFSKDDNLYPISIIGKSEPWSLNELYVIDRFNRRIPIGSFAKMEEDVSMATLPHHNQMRASNFMGMLIPIYSIESVIPMIENIAKEILPDSMYIEWTGAAELAKEASNTMLILFLTAIIFIYSILAIQFNSFTDPLIIMVTVPLACAGALLVNFMYGASISVYTHIGLITLIGLITKHGILLVDFANKEILDGKNIVDSITQAALLRLRPILMTTGAMILGAVPLVLSSGAGSEARHAIGIIIVGGLAFGTIFTLFVLPKIYCWVKKL
ncbi:MAG UNVERIFIED_CONTAM: efflux RND transporter permease subunit [Planctomycetaceae bacterium]|jgi:multidrug efflux pump